MDANPQSDRRPNPEVSEPEENGGIVACVTMTIITIGVVLFVILWRPS